MPDTSLAGLACDWWYVDVVQSLQLRDLSFHREERYGSGFIVYHNIWLISFQNHYIDAPIYACAL